MTTSMLLALTRVTQSSRVSGGMASQAALRGRRRYTCALDRASTWNQTSCGSPHLIRSCAGAKTWADDLHLGAGSDMARMKQSLHLVDPHHASPCPGWHCTSQRPQYAPWLTDLILVLVESHVDHVVLTRRLAGRERLTAPRPEEEHHARRARVAGGSGTASAIAVDPRDDVLLPLPAGCAATPLAAHRMRLLRRL